MEIFRRGLVKPLTESMVVIFEIKRKDGMNLMGGITKFLVKNVAFFAMDVIAPGMGTMAKQINRASSITNLLGPKATLERVEGAMDLMDNAADGVEDILSSFLDL